MPPRKQKVDHRKGGGGKHVSSMDDVKARNAGEESNYDRVRRERMQLQKPPSGKEEEKGEESSEEEVQEERKPARKAPAPEVASANPNAVKRNDFKEGIEFTRREREEMEKNAARRRYEELHKQGKTEEAQRDLARLDEVKKRREEAAQKKKDEAEAAKKKEEAATQEKPRSAMINELKDIMGPSTGKRGKKKKGDKDEEGEEGVEDGGAAAEAAEKEKEEKKEKKKDKTEKTWQESIADNKKGDKKVTDGTIEQCREMEDDFM